MTEPFGTRAMSMATRWLVLLSMALCAACTVQERYDSVRHSELGKCDRQVTERLQEECRQRIQQAMPESYQDYERQRRRLPRNAND